MIIKRKTVVEEKFFEKVLNRKIYFLTLKNLLLQYGY